MVAVHHRPVQIQNVPHASVYSVDTERTQSSKANQIAHSMEIEIATKQIPIHQSVHSKEFEKTQNRCQCKWYTLFGERDNITSIFRTERAFACLLGRCVSSFLFRPLYQNDTLEADDSSCFVLCFWFLLFCLLKF